MVIALPTTDSKGKKTTGDTTKAAGAATYEQQLEQQLVALFSEMEGVGRTKVMITVKAQEDASPSYLTITEDENEAAKIEGVCIVAEGAGNSRIKAQIIETVQALFGIDVNKIVVVKMLKQEES